jgi:hypothetical protein
MVERSACSCSHPTWKSASLAMAAKVSWTTSWVPVRSLPWVQCKRTTHEALMGCVHMHQNISIIERCRNPSRVWNVREKDGENNQKARKASQIISQVFALRLKHDKIQTWWISNILSKNMLEKVWWCKRSKMEFWNQTICCMMSCSKRRWHACVANNKRLQTTLKCYWKRKVLLSTHVKASKRKGCWSTINLTVMMEGTKAQLFK